MIFSKSPGYCANANATPRQRHNSRIPRARAIRFRLYLGLVNSHLTRGDGLDIRHIAPRLASHPASRIARLHVDARLRWIIDMIFAMPGEARRLKYAIEDD